MFDDAQLSFALIGMAGSVTVMAGYIVSLHKSHSRQIKELTEAYAKDIRVLLVQQLESSSKMITLIENNNKIIDKLT